MKQKNTGMNVSQLVKHVMVMGLKIDKDVSNAKNIII